MNFNKDIKFIFDIFKKSGAQIYLVGGCVRDMIMGLEPHDYDFTTNLTPELMKPLAFNNGVEYILTGEKYGTLTFRVNGTNYEITTFRADGNYSDGRRPDEVTFSNKLEEDLKRRDFTINALAMDSKGNIIDLYNGQEDIKNHIIRAIGDPDERFKEDALRVMRAIRFAYRFKFKLDFMTECALIGNIKNLKNVSQERIDSELLKTLDYKGFPDAPDYALEQVLNYILIYNFLPEMSNYNKVKVAINPFHDVMNYSNVNTKLAHFAFKCADGDAEVFYARNKFSNKLLKDIQSIIENYGRLISFDDRDYCIRKCLSLTGEENTLQAIQLFEDEGQPHFLADKYREIVNFTLSNHQPISLKDLALNGNDLKELGLEGKNIGKTLNKMLNLVLRDPSRNNKNYLIEIIKA